MTKVKGCALQMVCARASHAGRVWDCSAAMSGPSREAEEMTYKAACASVVSTAGSQRPASISGMDTRVL